MYLLSKFCRQAQATVKVRCRKAFATYLTTGILLARISLKCFADSISKDSLALIDILVTAITFVARKPAGPTVPFIVKPRNKGEPLAQFHVEIDRTVVVDVGNIVLILRLIPALAKPRS